MAHARQRRRGDRGRQRGREDEAAGVAAHAVDHAGRSRDEAAERPVALGQAALHHRHLGACSQRLRHAGALLPVGAGRVRLVQIRQGAVFGGQRADLSQRCDVPVHRIDGLEGDDAGLRGRQRAEQLAEVVEIVVAEDRALGPRGADAVDHRGVVALVREDHAALEQASECAQAGLVGDEARREHERGLLAVQVGELVLQLAHERLRAGDVARPARADAMLGERPRGRLDDGRVQAHAEVVVRAPVDGNTAAAVCDAHVRRAGRGALELDEPAVAALLAQRVEPALEGIQSSRERGMSVTHGTRWRRRAHGVTITSAAMNGAGR